MNYRAIVFWFSVITFLVAGTVAFGHATPPFAETFVFFSTNAAGEVTVYCFRTPTGG